MSVLIGVTDRPTHDEHAFVEEHLNRFNEEHTGIVHAQPLGVLVKDLAGDLFGGLIGRTSLGVLFIDLVFLPECLRNYGIGRKLIEYAEKEAQNRGCKRAILYTLEFQAPDFYLHLGYNIFGSIESDLPGHARVFMTKEL